MAVGSHPHPNTHRPETVLVDDLSLHLVYDESGAISYEVDEAPRMGAQISEGDPKYADYTRHESVSAIARFDGTYGLRIMSESRDPSKDQNATFESDHVDCSYGLPMMEPEQINLGLTAADGPVRWIGEFTPKVGSMANVPQIVVVAGTRVYVSTTGTAFSFSGLTLPAAPQSPQQITVFNDRVLFGFGETATAIYTENLTASAGNLVDDAAGTPLFAFAFTADHANCYLAGGTAAGDFAQVMGSTTGQDFTATTPCGRPDRRIRSLAPGGGLVTMYVGKEDELGAIDTAGVYRALIPFDSREITNSEILSWWLGRLDEQQRGPLALHFTRDRHLWEFSPSADNAGEARDITPWADLSRRPETVVGLPRSIVGSHRWLYYAIRDAGGGTWILRRDAITGQTTIWLTLNAPTTDCRAMNIIAIPGQNPCLYYADVGNTLGRVILPLHGEWPLDDPNCRYRTGTGSVTLCEYDLNLPDEEKILGTVSIIADHLLDGVRWLSVEYRVDDGDWIVLGEGLFSPHSELRFDAEIDTLRVHRVALRITLHNLDATRTPVIRAIALRWRLHPKPTKRWQIRAMIPAGRTSLPGMDPANPHRVLTALWALRTEGLPFVFVDRWRDIWLTYMDAIREVAGPQPHDRAPETIVQMVLMETTGALPASVEHVWRMPTFTTSWYPITACWPLVDTGVLDVAETITIQSTTTVYPRITIWGPFAWAVIINDTTGEQLLLLADIPHAQCVRLIMDPSRRSATLLDGSTFPGDVSGTFWGFVPGPNALRIRLFGASQGTYVRLLRRP